MLRDSLEEKVKKFADIPEEECVAILENNLLEALEAETFLEGEMISRFIFLAYPAREPLRKALSLAIRSNEQKIGPLSVKQWIDRYRKTYDNVERTPDTFFQFVSTDSEAQKLDKLNQRRLMRIFRMYDYLLSVPILGLTDTVMQILRFPLYIKPSIANTPLQESRPAPRKIIQAVLSEALAKSDKLGEQLLTNQPLKLPYFPSPVRPSIKNWIADYHQIYGTGIHSEMNRADYLFKSANAKSLSSEERQRVAFILKALDLELPVAIDSDVQQILFDKPEQKTATVERNDTNTPDPHLKPDTANSLANKISFSSPQKLSFEKMVAPAKTPAAPANLPTGNLARPAQFGGNQTGRTTDQQPYRITPSGSRQQIVDTKAMPRVLPKNVVNLRD